MGVFVIYIFVFVKEIFSVLGSFFSIYDLINFRREFFFIVKMVNEWAYMYIVDFGAKSFFMRKHWLHIMVSSDWLGYSYQNLN